MAPKTTKSDQLRWYITTAIPYVNAQPHIGFALEIVLADTLARYHRMIGDDVRFLTGSDENSLKNVQAAERLGIPTRELVEANAAKFEGLRGPLDLSFDDFIRTSSEPRHFAGVQKLWEACAAHGDVYTKPYNGLYCVGCEQFYTADELVDGRCPDHHTQPESVAEENYFFRLSRYQDALLRLIESDALRIVPATRRNEVLSFIRMGLEDFSISRSRKRAHGWGVPVPGDPEQVMYVWYDALGNYITALGYADDDMLFRRYWVENPHRVHVIGKDILRFHAVYWPAMLLSAGVELPTDIFVHGFITVEGKKMSKSLGNVLDPVILADQLGTDPLRYYLLREIQATADGDFSQERFIRSYDTDLADQLGNLLNRTVSMVERYFGGTVPAPGAVEDPDAALIVLAEGLRERVDIAMRRFSPHEALTSIWELIGGANKYVAEMEPWRLAKRRKTEPAAEQRLATVLYNTLEALRLAAIYCAPFIPATAQVLSSQLGLTLDALGDLEAATRWGGFPAGTTLHPSSVLFPKRELPRALGE